MRCAKCPLFTSWNNENDRGEACMIFGDGWEDPFQYEDKDGTTIGCYIEKAYIDKVDRRVEEMHEQAVQAFLEEEKEVHAVEFYA